MGELNDFLARELAEDGYAGCEVRVTPTRTEVIIRATRPRQVVGDQGRRVREITALVQKRFKYQKGQIILFAEKIRNKGLSALAQAQAVKFRLLQGLSVRRAAYSVVKFIMLPHDPTGENGISRDLPDAIKVHDPDKADAFNLGQPQSAIPDMVQPPYMSTMPQTDVRNLDNNNAGPPPQQQMDDDNDNQPDDNANMMQAPQQMNDQPPQNMMQNQGGFNQQY